MPRIIRETPPKETEIYVLISQISNEFFVSKIKFPNHYQAYKDHVGLKNAQTRELFRESEKQNKFPKMYLLNHLNTDAETGFKHCVAWTKYFIEHGYKPLSEGRILDYAKDLLDETKIIYEGIKDIPLDETLSDTQLLVENYIRKKGSKSTRKNDAISFRISQKEYEAIAQRAENTGLSMAKYCKNMALNGEVNLIKTYTAYDILNEMRAIRITLTQTMNAICINGRYYPEDIRIIQECIEKQRELYEQFAEKDHENFKKEKLLFPK